MSKRISWILNRADKRGVQGDWLADGRGTEGRQIEEDLVVLILAPEISVTCYACYDIIVDKQLGLSFSR